MSLTVSARASTREFSFRHASMLNALDHGLSLLTSGMTDVRIVDAGGRSYSPAALHQLMFGPRAAESARVVETAEPTKLAA